MDKDYKEKIRKLLALAESPNEHEARAALLKARQLMAEHKLTEAELKDVEKQQVKDVRTDITCSKRRDPWIVNLSAVIGENYCCKGYRYRRYGEQTNCIGFIGLEDDVEICVAVFKYAVDCVLSEIKNIKKENACYYSDYVKRLCNSYGYGFTAGATVMPKEVEEASQHLGHEQFQSRAQKHLQGSEYYRGFGEGTEFDPTKRLGEEATV